MVEKEILNFFKKLDKEKYQFKIPNEKCKIALMKAIEEMSKFDNFIGILNHTFRVAANALYLAQRKRLSKKDKEIVFLAACFHDVYKKDKGRHTVKGALFAKKILKELNYDEEICNNVHNAILVHTESFLKPSKITEKILYDADKLDKIGCTGILRRATNLEESKESKWIKLIEQLKNDKTQKFYLVISKKIAKERIKNENEILNL